MESWSLLASRGKTGGWSRMYETMAIWWDLWHTVLKTTPTNSYNCTRERYFVCLHVIYSLLMQICDRLRENPPYGIFYENLVCYIFGKYYHRTNLPPSLRPIARFAISTERYLCTRATNVKIIKSWSKAVATHAQSVSVHYTYTRVQLLWCNFNKGGVARSECEDRPESRPLPSQLFSRWIWSTKGMSLFCRRMNIAWSE